MVCISSIENYAQLLSQLDNKSQKMVCVGTMGNYAPTIVTIATA